VVAESSGIPVRRARVTLSAPELRGGRSTITDDSGRFSFQSLPAGRFTMTASKAGYVDITFGAKRAGRPGTPIQLADGQKLERLSMSLPRGGVLTGVVIDEYGEPAAGTPVRAFRYVMRTGERSLQQVGQDQTDDRGAYRIYGLQPGEYLVSAVPRNMTVADLRDTLANEIAQRLQAVGDAGSGRGGGPFGGAFGANGGRGGPIIDRVSELQTQLAQNAQLQQTAYAPVYYPGTITPATAASITLAIGEERSGVDFQLQLVSTTRVAGTVTVASGALPPNAQVSLAPADATGMPSVPGLGNYSTRVGPDGRFAFANVTPGHYTLQARAVVREVEDAQASAVGRGGRGGAGGFGQIAQVLWAAMDLAVDGRDVPDTVLNLQPGMTVSGRIAFEGSAAPPTDLSRVRISLVPRGTQGFDVGPVPPAEIETNGRFTIKGVAPGRYALNGLIGAAGQGRGGRGGVGPVSADPAGMAWTLTSASVSGQEALDFPIEIAPNQDVTGALVTFSDRTQELSGTIQDIAGRPTSDFTIIVFPGDRRYWLPQARRIVASRPATDGRFIFRNLPPGDYRLTAVTDVEPGEWYDTSFLTQLLQVSIPVSVATGEKKVQDIKLAGG
jgi:uncharacterized protein (DUF2141 family)